MSNFIPPAKLRKEETKQRWALYNEAQQLAAIRRKLASHMPILTPSEVALVLKVTRQDTVEAAKAVIEETRKELGLTDEKTSS